MQYLILAGAIGVIILVIAVLVVRAARRNHQNEIRKIQEIQKPVVEWLDKVSANRTSDEKLADLPDPPDKSLWLDLANEVEYWMEDIEVARRNIAEKKRLHEEAVAEATHHLLLLEETSSFDEAKKSILYFDRSPRTNEKLRRLYLDEEQLVRLKDRVDWWMTCLLSDARDGLKASFKDLTVLTREYGNGTSPSSYRYATGSFYESPADWNELVVRYFRVPTIGDLRNVPENIIEGTTRLMAAAALKDRSLVNAQLVLALCNAQSSKRKEVGDVMTAELAKMVESLRSSLIPATSEDGSNVR